MAEEIEFDISYKQLMRELEAFDKDMPNVAVKLMRAVNAEITKKVRATASSRGYHASKQVYYKTLGDVDAGYKKNLKGYAQRDYSAKIKMLKNAYYYRFIEYGAEIPERIIHVDGKKIKLRGFSYPANPLIYPIADSYWKTSKSIQIMDKKMQQIIDKQMKEKK